MMNMSSWNLTFSFIFTIFCNSLVLPFVMSHPLPLNESPYEKFIDFLLKSNCTMPKEIKLPFSKSSDPSPFSYLSTPLSECRTSEALDENSESNMLCREVFDVIQNITCSEIIEPISKIENGNLSLNVCNDFKSMKDIFPVRNDYLSRKLTDEIICKVLCTSNKYELLCKTLLWSYDTLTKIQNGLEKEIQDDVKEKTRVSSGKVLSSIKVSLGKSKLESDNKNDDVLSNLNAGNKNLENEKLHDKSHLDHSRLEISDTKSPNDGSTTVSSSSKFSVLTYKIQNESSTINNSATPLKLLLATGEKNISETENLELPQKVLNKAANPIVTDTVNLSNQNLIDDHINHKENEMNNEPVKNVIVDNKSQENNTNVLKGNTGGIKIDQNVKNLSEEILQSKEKDREDTTMNQVKNTEYTKNVENKKTSVKVEGSRVPDIEMNNISPQENESKDKKPDFNTQDEKELEKPPNEALPDVDVKLPESSTMQILPDDDTEEHQEDKDQDQYNDTENEGDYQKADYDNFNLPTKNRETNIKSSISGPNQISNNYDGFISSRNNIIRGPEEVPMIPFPEQEDSHFFFYFLTVVLIFMAGYLIFHNKQKIIALIVEGRHERRRRSHGAGYKKLETK